MAEQVAAAVPTPAADPKATPAIPATTEPTRDYNVNGKVVKLTQKQADAYTARGLNADQKLKSMEVLRGKTSALINALKTDPLSVLKDPSLGVNIDSLLEKILGSEASDATKEKLSAWVYQNVVQKSKMTPEQLDQDKKLSDYERLKKQEEDRNKADVTAKQQAQVNQIYQAVRSEVTKQIVADKTFPQTEGSIRAVVEKLRVMTKKGAPLTNENVGKALELVKKDHLLHQQTMLDAIKDEDPESLINLIGEARALRISKALVARLKLRDKAKVKDSKPQETQSRRKITDELDEKNQTLHGYRVMDVNKAR